MFRHILSMVPFSAYRRYVCGYRHCAAPISRRTKIFKILQTKNSSPIAVVNKPPKNTGDRDSRQDNKRHWFSMQIWRYVEWYPCFKFCIFPWCTAIIDLVYLNFSVFIFLNTQMKADCVTKNTIERRMKSVRLYEKCFSDVYNQWVSY